MSLKIRLSRGGSKHRPYYRIVIADTRSPRDGRFIEKIGSFNPLLPKDRDDRVVLDLEVKKDTLAGYYSGPTGDIPLIDKRQVASQVLVDNGQTVVLGGVYEVNKSDTLTKVPLLGDIPVLGNLFKNKGRTDTKAELLIFVTPRILSDSLK